MSSNENGSLMSNLRNLLFQNQLRLTNIPARKDKGKSLTTKSTKGTK